MAASWAEPRVGHLARTRPAAPPAGAPGGPGPSPRWRPRSGLRTWAGARFGGRRPDRPGASARYRSCGRRGRARSIPGTRWPVPFRGRRARLPAATMAAHSSASSSTTGSSVPVPIRPPRRRRAAGGSTLGLPSSRTLVLPSSRPQVAAPTLTLRLPSTPPGTRLGTVLPGLTRPGDRSVPGPGGLAARRASPAGVTTLCG